MNAELTLFFVWAYFEVCRKNALASARNKKYCAAHPERVLEKRARQREQHKIYARNHYAEHGDDVRVRSRKYGQDHKAQINARARERRKTDINFRLLGSLRGRIKDAITRGDRSAHTKELLGCSVEELKTWLAGWFAPGMTWENYGEWHIDHHRPCASFDLSDPAQQRLCFNYLNLRPLWAKDNMSKGAK